MDETSKSPVDTRIKRKRNASERRAFVAGVGRKLRFVVLVHLPLDMDEDHASRMTGDVIEKENVRAGNCKKQPLSGTFIVGPRSEVTFDGPTRDSSRDLVVEFTGDVLVRKTDRHIRNPLEVELDRDVFVQLRDLLMLLTRKFGIVNGGGEISLGDFKTNITLTNGRLTSENDPIVEVNPKDVVTVAVTGDPPFREFN
ncbi:MAG: hypothetical protein WCO25_02345 [Candidatus Uhrbacteria bacterium]